MNGRGRDGGVASRQSTPLANTGPFIPFHPRPTAPGADPSSPGVHRAEKITT